MNKTRYKTLNAEIARSGLKKKEIAQRVGLPRTTFSKKLRRGPWPVEQAIKIKEILMTDMPLEKLFEEDEDN